MDTNMLIALAGFVVAVVSNIVAITRVYSKMEARIDVLTATVHAERRGLEDKILSLTSEVNLLRGQKHDHTGTVMRHEGAIKDIDRRLTRVENRMDHIHGAES